MAGNLSSGSARRSARVLVVDDEPMQLRIYTRILTKAGYIVETAGDGQTAIEMLKNGSVDAILSDIVMPGMDGIQLLRAVRQYDLDVPIVMVTGTPTLETAIAAMEHGVFRYLIKPVDAVALEDIVTRAVQLHEMAKMKREALALIGTTTMRVDDRAGLEANFARMLKSLWIAYHPIVSVSK